MGGEASECGRDARLLCDLMTQCGGSTSRSIITDLCLDFNRLLVMFVDIHSEIVNITPRRSHERTALAHWRCSTSTAHVSIVLLVHLLVIVVRIHRVVIPISHGLALSLVLVAADLEAPARKHTAICQNTHQEITGASADCL